MYNFIVVAIYAMATNATNRPMSEVCLEQRDKGVPTLMWMNHQIKNVSFFERLTRLDHHWISLKKSLSVDFVVSKE